MLPVSMDLIFLDSLRLRLAGYGLVVSSICMDRWRLLVAGFREPTSNRAQSATRGATLHVQNRRCVAHGPSRRLGSAAAISSESRYAWAVLMNCCMLCPFRTHVATETCRRATMKSESWAKEREHPLSRHPQACARLSTSRHQHPQTAFLLAPVVHMALTSVPPQTLLPLIHLQRAQLVATSPATLRPPSPCRLLPSNDQAIMPVRLQSCEQ